jgi:hypothetical protein
MRVDIEEEYVDSYNKIVKEANGKIVKIQKDKCERVLLRKDISAESKKKELVKNLHGLIISTFSIKKFNNKALENVKANVGLIRKVLHKIKSINNYLEESFLGELGIIKKSLMLKAIKSNRPEKYLEKNARVISKKHIDSLEHAVYELMQKIVFFDKKLVKQYKKTRVKIIKTEKIGIKDLEKILKIQSEILDAIEAKIPPSNKIKAKLFGKQIFNKWIPMVFALLSGFEAEYGKEKVIFSKIKKNDKLRKKIEDNIDHVVNEKERILKIKEKRALSMNNIKISDDYRQTFHEYVSAVSL